jgi:hypothetical protein
MNVETNIDAGGIERLSVTVKRGSLALAGHDEAAIAVESPSAPERAYAPGGEVALLLMGDSALTVPRSLRVSVVRVDGDARVRALATRVEVGAVGGLLQVENAADVLVESVGGDFDCRGARKVEAGAVGGHLACEEVHSLAVSSVGGTAVVSRCGGDCRLGAVGLGLLANDVAGVLAGTAGMDASASSVGGGARLSAGRDLAIAIGGGASWELAAGGDAVVTVPDDAAQEVFLAAGGRIEVGLPTMREAKGRGLRVFTLGVGGAPLRVTAGGDVRLRAANASDSAAGADDETSIVMRLLESGRISADDAGELLSLLDAGESPGNMSRGQ